MTYCTDEPVVINGDNAANPSARVKTTADLHGTDWSYTTTYSEFLCNLFGSYLSDVENFEDGTITIFQKPITRNLFFLDL